MSSGSSFFYDSELGTDCPLCDRACIELRTLPCDHSVCESCILKHHAAAEASPNADIKKCPVCDKKVTSPKGQKTIQQKSTVKIDDDRVLYNQAATNVEANVGINSGSNDDIASHENDRQKVSFSLSLQTNEPNEAHPPLRRSAPAMPKSRSAMVFAAPPTNFESRISTDLTDCIYWGGGVLNGGDIILADYYNFTLKVFAKNGEFITSLKYFPPPLGVTVLSGDQMVVIFGSTQLTVCFVAYKKRRLHETRRVSLAGYMYTTVRYKDGCLGIFQHKYRSVQCSLMVIREDQSMTSLDIGDISKHLLTESGLAYIHQKDLIYFTRKIKLFCFRSDGKFVFEKMFHALESLDESTDKSATDGAYRLGAIATDANCDLFIASDQCVLHVSADGELVQIIHTTVDPYHVIVSKSGSNVIVVGKGSVVELVPVVKETLF